MALFRRKKAEKPVTKEVEQYIKAEKRERAGLAWLLALVAMAVAALVIIALFFGGRWAYDRIWNDEDSSSTQTASSQSNNSTSKEEAKTEDSSSDDNTESSDSDDDSTSSSTETSDEDTEDTTGDTETSSSSESKEETKTEDLAETGPATPFGLMALVAVISTALYRRHLKKQL